VPSAQKNLPGLNVQTLEIEKGVKRKKSSDTSNPEKNARAKPTGPSYPGKNKK